MQVVTTNNEGLCIDFWADRLLQKIIYVAEDSDSHIADQARAYKENLRPIIAKYMENAIKSNHTSLYNLFIQQGHKDMAEILRKL